MSNTQYTPLFFTYHYLTIQQIEDIARPANEDLRPEKLEMVGVLETLAESEEDEGEIFLKKIDAEMSRILDDDDVLDTINLFSTLPSYDMLIADRK